MIRLFLLVVLLAVSGCSGDAAYALRGERRVVNSDSGEIRAQPAFNLPGDASISAETAAAAGALYVYGHPVKALGLPGKIFSHSQSALLYVLYDPLAPNWSLEETAFGEETYHLSLKAKGFRVGGDGEALQIFKRRAAYLQRAGGFSSYRILDYSEGIESSTPLTHRVGQGTFQLVRAAAMPAR